jgi:alpha-glucuronidase
MANLYGFGRLAWNPDTTPQAIADDWTRLTFGNDSTVVRTIDDMLLSSWPIYEEYTGPLGLGTLTDILHSHYGPGIESAERNGWGQWIRANQEGVGMDRTVATGTGYIGQYPPEVASMYESLATCPDTLLLFMHHVSYTYTLHSGKTVIQHIYDSHDDGAAGAANLVTEWEGLKGRIDDERYQKVLALTEYQAGHAIVWRDAVNQWFYKMSGIADAKGRVGHDPDRIEAESMQLEGYVPVDVTPWETASGGKGVVCKSQAVCTAITVFSRSAGAYDIAAHYFDFRHGASTYDLYLNGDLLKEWRADNSLPGDQMNGDTSTRVTVRAATLKPGDVLKIEGKPDNGEPAPLDYIEITPSGVGVHP